MSNFKNPNLSFNIHNMQPPPFLGANKRSLTDLLPPPQFNNNPIFPQQSLSIPKLDNNAQESYRGSLPNIIPIPLDESLNNKQKQSVISSPQQDNNKMPENKTLQGQQQLTLPPVLNQPPQLPISGIKPPSLPGFTLPTQPPPMPPRQNQQYPTPPSQNFSAQSLPNKMPTLPSPIPNTTLPPSIPNFPPPQQQNPGFIQPPTLFKHDLNQSLQHGSVSQQKLQILPILGQSNCAQINSNGIHQTTIDEAIRLQKEEEKRRQEELKLQDEQIRLEAQRKIEELHKMQMEEQRRREEEGKRKEEEERRRQEEEERKKKEEERRWREEEIRRRREEERRWKEEEMERKKQEEEDRRRLMQQQQQQQYTHNQQFQYQQPQSYQQQQQIPSQQYNYKQEDHNQKYLRAHNLYAAHLLSQGYTQEYIINFMNTYPNQYKQYCFAYLQQVGGN